MSHTVRGVLAFFGACFVVAALGFVDWRIGLGVAGLALVALSFRPGPPKAA